MRAISIVGLAMLAVASQAQFTPVSNSAALGANDYIDWADAFGAEGTSVGDNSTGFTHNGVGFTISSLNNNTAVDDGGGFTRLDEDSGWGGEFQPGDHLLYHQLSLELSGPDASIMQIHIDRPVYGVGVQSQAEALGNFASICAMYDSSANLLGSTQSSGTNNGWNLTHTGSAYVGGYDGVADITDFYVVSFMSDNSDNHGFAVGRVDVLTQAPVPEPASATVLALGVIALLRTRRTHRA